MKVMIVEDDAIIAMLLQTEVERQGFTSLGPVATAAAAVQLAAEGKPDIVLMDIRLQGDVDGITAAALISANQNVDIIFITAFSDPTSLSRIEPLEPAGYLLKPFTARNLFVTLSVCASNRHIRLERDRLTRAIDQLQLLHSSVMENSPDGIICVDDKGEIVAANDAASRMFALPMDTLVGSPLNRLVPVDKAAGHPALFDSFLEGGGAQHHQMADRETLRGRRGDSTFPASIALSKFTFEGRTMCTAIVRDITHQLAREERRRQGEKLQAIGKFSASIAHDVNNLLTVVLGAASLLPRTQNTPVFNDIVQELSMAGRRGADLTQRLLMFAHHGERVQVLVEVDATVADLLPLLQRLAGPAVRIEQILASGSSIRLEQGELEQVLINLVANARDAMPEGGVIQMVTSSRWVDGQQRIDLRVTDNGQGMDAETQARCFSAFFTTKAAGDGTGLGLQTVAEIAVRAGGACDVQSELGAGTTFHISFPGTAESPTHEPAMERSFAVNGAGRRVLIVDPDPSALRLTAAVLQDQGFSTIAVQGALAALHLVESDPDCADVLLCEAQLPFMDGFQVAAAVRRNCPNMAIVMMSSGSAAWMADSDSGNARMLSKPVPVDVLARVIQSARPQA